MSDPTLVKVRSTTNTKTITTLAMLSAIAYVIMLVSKLLPSVNGFLDFDFKDVVICIGGFVFGPMASASMAIVVAFVEMITVSHTGIIGFVMNALATCAFCCTATFIYKKRHTMAGAVLGLLLGVIALTVIMLLWNYFLTPIYQGMPRDAVAAMLVPIFLPFNLVKGGMNMAATLLPGRRVPQHQAQPALPPLQRRFSPLLSGADGYLYPAGPGPLGRDLNSLLPVASAPPAVCRGSFLSC